MSKTFVPSFEWETKMRWRLKPERSILQMSIFLVLTIRLYELSNRFKSCFLYLEKFFAVLSIFSDVVKAWWRLQTVTISWTMKSMIEELVIVIARPQRILPKWGKSNAWFYKDFSDTTVLICESCKWKKRSFHFSHFSADAFAILEKSNNDNTGPQQLQIGRQPSKVFFGFHVAFC